MNKNAIKKYAVWARNELIARVTQKAEQYEITEKKITSADADSIGGRLLTDAEKKQRAALIEKIKEDGFEQVMEEVAYTWFNRFTALRFMEVNNYLPSHTRVFTNEAGEFKPQILADAIQLELDGLDMDKVLEMKDANKNEELYKYLLIVQCNALSSILPRMFQKIEHYTELLLPDYLLREGSVIEQMIALIPEEDWTDQVQIIGWLYQYYIAEPKDERINARKQYKKEDISFVTQLFTSDWIVRYMVENSLGRLWLEGHPNDDLKMEWEYYLEEAEQEPDVQAQLAGIRNGYAALKPEEILVIDPCQGSGHILAYMFDVLVQIYEVYGYSAREAASSIVEHNIWGLDIDERATQLAYFSVIMKARQYDRRFFSRGIQPHVYAIQESNNLDPHCIEFFVDGRPELKLAMDSLVEELHDAKEYGSILKITQVDFQALYARFNEIRNEIVPNIYSYQTLEILFPFVQVAQTLSNKYMVVVTNPPYMNSSYMPQKLKAYVAENYSDYKSDLFAVFTKRVIDFSVENGQIGLLMPYVWMFISSYEKMRKLVNQRTSISTLVQLEYNAFEAACVPVAALTLRKTNIHSTGEYIRLSEFKGIENQAPRTIAAIKDQNCGYRFTTSQNAFHKIPGELFAYWVGKGFVDAYENGTIIGDFSIVSEGIKTGDNNRFLRLWSEVDATKFSFGNSNSGKKWYPHNKGGDYRKWYGNFDWVINWENDGFEIKNAGNSGLQGKQMYFKEYASASKIGTGRRPFRYYERNILFDSGAPAFSNDKVKYCLALLNSAVGQYYFQVISPTINLQVGDIKSVPVLGGKEEEISSLADACIQIEKEDWNSFETSWDFSCHPLLKYRKETIEEAYSCWEVEANNRFVELKKHEEQINEIFIMHYGLKNELESEESDSNISLSRPDLKREIQSLISFSVGCMFGRYSLDESGLIYAGGKWDATKYKKYIPDKDAIIPICDDEYFDDDIVARFVDFIEIAYGKNSLEGNLKFIADVLGGKGSPREVIRSYFLTNFYADHCTTYSVTGSGKRPIYWLFDSGKKNGFKCLVYMHRYQPDTIARIRTDYVHEQQSRYRTAIADLEQRINGASTSERVKLNKRLTAMQAQATEIREYEEKIHHLADQMISIDLDDGVKHNYEIFKDVLAKIK